MVSTEDSGTNATEAASSASIEIGTREHVTLGRAPDNDLALDDLRVSRHHPQDQLSPLISPRGRRRR